MSEAPDLLAALGRSVEKAREARQADSRIDRAAIALMDKMSTDGHEVNYTQCREYAALAIAAAGLLASPANDAAVAARALRAAQSDIKARIRHMGRYGASGDYISALNDAWGLLNNRVRDIEREGGAS